MKTIEVEIPIIPQSKLRPAFGRGAVYTRKKTRAYERTIAEYARLAIMQYGGVPLEGAVVGDIEFTYPYPQSWAKKRCYRQPKLSTPDLDNLVKAVLDAMNGIAFTDDARVWKTTASKWWGDKPLISIRLTSE